MTFFVRSFSLLSFLIVTFSYTSKFRSTPYGRKDIRYCKNGIDDKIIPVPAGLIEAASLMKGSLAEVLSSKTSKKLFSIDLLTPGLNPKLENKAILYQEYLFDIITSIIPVLTNQHENGNYRTAQLMFDSTGAAAGFQKYCSQMGIQIPDFLGLNDLDGKRVRDEDDCLVFIAARNNVGDPVINMIEKIVKTFPEVTCVFLNCDLTDTVATGMQNKAGREAFRSSITPAFYFRNIVRVERPSLTPNELGAILYTPSTGFQIYAVNMQDIHGSGSLNRFMIQAVFRRHPNDPTTYNPPRFTLAGQFSSMPKRDDIDSTMSRAAFLLKKGKRDLDKSTETKPWFFF
jgi:hypothetical protein